ncbi:MAG: hypothetical protein LV477_11210, partial [Candidatus Nitrosotalea sp.]|nr:hypothetical protein [Candidatus Nitrosotalea sp.]
MTITMYNETIRKITSLTLLTILVASSAVVGLPNALPHAQASTNANLFVSAENSQWNNYFAGPQVIQVVVADPDINRLDQQYGEPVVTVGGKRLRMMQATDGNWYAYFADRNQAIAADKTAPVAGKGLNFGEFCDTTGSLAGSLKTGLSFADTKGFTIATTATGSLNGSAVANPIVNDCSADKTAHTAQEHVVRQNKTINTNPSGFGNGLNSTLSGKYWPIIQLYDFSAIPSTVVVDYQKNGGDQIVNLVFDRIPQNLITTTVDRSAYPQNTQVFVQLNDPQLNIDPTEEDSWTWGANATNSTVYYEAFNRNGAADADGFTSGGKLAMQNLAGNLTTFMFNHNGKLTINPSAQGVRVVDFAGNGKQLINGSSSNSVRGNPAHQTTNSIGINSEPITFIEQGGVNTGVYGNWDGGKKADIITVDSPTIRGQSAVVRYNDISTSIVGGFSFASLTQTAQNNTWASGQRIPVTLTDNDDNKNGKISERMFLWDPTYKRSTAMKIGTPFTLSSGSPQLPNEQAIISNVKITKTHAGNLYSTLGFTGKNATATNLAEDEAFSARPIFNFTNATGSGKVIMNSTTSLIVDLKTTFNTLLQTIHNTNNTASKNPEGFKGFNFLNYDLRSFTTLNGANSTISAVNVYLVYQTTAGQSAIFNSTGYPVGALKAISIANSTQAQDFINLNSTDTTKVASPANLNGILFNSTVTKSAPIGLMFKITTSSPRNLISTAGQPIVADFFSVGLIGDGTQNSQRINNGIYRYELEETGDNTGVFTGTNQYVMLNQLNIFDPNTYANLRPIQHDVFFPAIQDMLQSEARAPQVTYLDLGQDGVNTQISAQQDIPTHTGVISFDSKTYKIGDTVTITLSDQDLNVNNDLIDIYTAVTPAKNPSGSILQTAQDNATDTIGKANLGQLS